MTNTQETCCPTCGEIKLGSEHHDCIRALMTHIANSDDKLALTQEALRLACDHEAAVLLQLPEQFQMPAEEIYATYIELAWKELPDD